MHDISDNLLSMTLGEDEEGPFFILEVIDEGTIKRVLAEPLDPINRASNEYDGRLLILGEIAEVIDIG